MNGPDVGEITSIVLAAQKHTLAGGNGVFLSTDDGNTWRQTNTGMGTLSVRALVYDTASGIFAGTASGVIRSTDNGVSWNQAGLSDVSVTSLCEGIHRDLYAGTEHQGIFRTTDDGATWHLVNSSLTITIVYSLAVNTGGTVFAGTAGTGVFMSSDNGDSWTQVNNGMPETPSVSTPAIDESGRILAGTLGSPGSGLLRSTNNGSSWIQVATPLSYPFVKSVAVTPAGDIFFGSYSSFYRSSNGGSTWTEISLNPVDARVSALAIRDDGMIFAGTGGMARGMFRSVDNGDSWDWLTRGLIFPKYLSAVAFNRRDDVFFGSILGEIVRSTDLGATWSIFSVHSGGSMPRVNDIAVNASNSLFAGTSGGIFRSTDNGESWTPVNHGLSDLIVLAVAIDSEQTIYAGTQTAGIFRSTNEGADWNGVWDASGSMVTSLAADANGRIFAGAGGLFRSTDHGTTWSSTGLPYPVLSMTVTKNGHLFAATNEPGWGIGRSTDEGDTWNPCGNGAPTYNLTVLCSNPAGHIFVGTRDQPVCRSVDTGLSWTQFSSGLWSFEIMSLRSTQNGFLFAGVSETGICRTVGSTTGVDPARTQRITAPGLWQNWPNPFNSMTRIRFEIPRGTDRGHARPVSLKVYDLLGRCVKTLVEGILNPGMHEVTFDASGCASGAYVYQLNADSFTQVRTLLLVK